MKAHWRKVIALLPLGLEQKIYTSHFKLLHSTWVKNGTSFPPSHWAKQQLVKRYATDHQLSVFVETGTYLGDMVFAMQNQFRQLYSIELSPLFYEAATTRFKGFEHIKILQGDSGEVLKDLVPTLESRALFWLDGHYSGGQTAKGAKDCPIYEELKSILSSPLNHVILIDDARLFIGANDYPTVHDLKNFILSFKVNSQFAFENDAIIITFN